MVERLRTESPDPLNIIWAKSKPFHPLHYHLVDTGWVAYALLHSSAFQSVIARFSEASNIDAHEVTRLLSYFAAMHDIGKCHSRFVFSRPESLAAQVSVLSLPRAPDTGRFYHNAMSKRWMMDYLIDEMGWPYQEALTVSTCLAGHHGDFCPDIYPDERDDVKAAWEPLRRRIESMVRSTFCPASLASSFANHSSVGMILSGILTLSDWIASNAELFPMGDFNTDFEKYSATSAVKATAAVEKIGFHEEHPARFGPFFVDVWPKFKTPWPIQREIERLCNNGSLSTPGLVIIEAPMGEGKTEAALYLALQWIRSGLAGGLYMALPTTATSNQMHGRTYELLSNQGLIQEQGVRLVHGTAWLIDSKTPEEHPTLEDTPEGEADHALEWFRPSKRALLAAYGVGTVDQAMGSVLHVKHSYLKLFGLSGKVLIIDEIHAYDAYMSQIIKRLLQWCQAIGIPVVLLSATLPNTERLSLMEAYAPRHAAMKHDRCTENQVSCTSQTRESNPYPLITYVSRDGQCADYAVPRSSRSSSLELIKHWGSLQQPEQIADLVLSRFRDGGCHCVIANTVGSAQRIYCELRKRMNHVDSNDNLMLFHARFPAWRKQAIENKVTTLFGPNSLLRPDDPKWAKRPDAAILVATQVVEQSLDVDFDEMFSEIAPVDLLLQRVGRMHRHKRSPRPTGPLPRYHLLLPDKDRVEFGVTSRIYDTFILLKTLSSLVERDKIILPDDIRPLVELVYDGSAELPYTIPGVNEELTSTLWTNLINQLADEAKKAARYLIPPPSQKAFELARIATPSFDTDDGEAQKYFHARTRLDDDSHRILVLESNAFESELSSQKPPKRDIMRALLEHGVNVPAWWFEGSRASSGYSEYEEAPKWLPGVKILRTQGGEWKGVNQKGDEFSIVNDSELGLLRKDTQRR
jgi:CRISPR-associated endonuclease/helicase Cas3